MNKFMSRFSLLFAIALLLHLFVAPLQNTSANTDGNVDAPSWTTPIDYVALGDSLAAGMDPQGGLGLGYPDFLAGEIEGTGFLNSYSNDFSLSGYTAAKVLADLKENVTRNINEAPVKLHEAIAEAELITISAGANDVLPLIAIDPTTGAVTYDLAAINTAIIQVGANVNQIITEIHEINPNAQVYVMGYYNPFPHMPAEIQPLLENLLTGINLSLGTATNNPNVEFVPTKDVIAEDFAAYLPNPQNIHLSEAGYKKVADQFWNEMQTTYPWAPKNTLVADLVATNSVNLQWKPANGEVTSYEVYSGEEKLAAVAGDVHTYKVANIEEATDYVFSIIAVDEAGNKSAHNPTVEVTTVETPPMFADIDEHWGKHEIELAAMARLFSGYTDGTFRPDNHLTRAQAASILVRALELKTNESAPFTDIENYAEQTRADINAAYKFGLVKGSNDKFMPSNRVTRAQLALMIERAYSLKTDTKYVAAAKAPYADFGNYGPEAVNAISMLYELGIATGDNGKFMPGNPTTRAHAAKMLINLLGS